MVKNLKINKEKNKALLVSGILSGSRAFLGPEVLHIDLTNRCNFNCIACWCRSPLLAEKQMPDWEKKLILPFEKIKQVFDDLSTMGGLKQVKLVGGGEPFMHPDIVIIVEYIKSKDQGIEIDINTNFSLVDKDKADRLLELGLDSFTVSLWAGTPQTYAAIHPNQNDETFLNIEKVLKYIALRKKELNKKTPRILIHDVVFKQNYRDFPAMLDFALNVGADAIQFVPVDVVKEKTETLLMDDYEKKELLEELQIVRSRYDANSFIYTAPDGGSLFLPDLDNFIKRIEKINVKSGIYDKELVTEIPCYVGWLFARIMATGSVVPCCKGHRMSMGNIFKNSFKDIWHSSTYNLFRKNGLKLHKSHPYFSKMGNDADKVTGCYNCDNLWQNIPIHREILKLKSNRGRVSLFRSLMQRFFNKK